MYKCCKDCLYDCEHKQDNCEYRWIEDIREYGWREFHPNDAFLFQDIHNDMKSWWEIEMIDEDKDKE